MADLLIVDDDADLADLVGEVLADEGHQVRLATNGADGLRQVEAKIPDMIVLDVEMPELDGPAMALRMYLNDRGLEDVPIVLVSGVVDLQRIAAHVGTPYYLTKPYSAAAVTRMCKRALAERVPPRPPAAPPRV